MNMQNDEYRRYADRHAPRSQVGRNCLGAFLVGGTICCLGQLLFTLFQAAGLDEQAAGTAESVSLIALGATLPPARPLSHPPFSTASTESTASQRPSFVIPINIAS